MVSSSVCACIVAQSCPALSNPVDRSLLGFSAHGIFHSKNTGMGCHFLFQGIFPTQGSNLCLLCLLHWQAGSLQLNYLGSPRFPPEATAKYQPIFWFAFYNLKESENLFWNRVIWWQHMKSQLNRNLSRKFEALHFHSFFFFFPTWNLYSCEKSVPNWEPRFYLQLVLWSWMGPLPSLSFP